MGGEARYRLEGFAVPAELDRVHALIDRVREDHPDVDPTVFTLFGTAMIEIAGNIVEHGRPKDEVRWWLLVTIDEREICADLVDTADEAIVDLDADMPDVEAEGGRGLPLTRALVDEMSVERTADGNHWRLVRRLS